MEDGKIIEAQLDHYHKIWIDQCEAAQNIKERYGLQKALGYLIGEKLAAFIEASDRDPGYTEELPKFIAEIKEIFKPWEIREYLDNVQRIGTFGHVCTDEQVEIFRAAGAIPDDPVEDAEEILLVERMKKLLLSTSYFNTVNCPI
jgi:hypothetical protein